MSHEERVEGILSLLVNEDGKINTKDAFMALGEAAGCILAFAPAEQRETYVRTLALHVRGVAEMRK